MPRTSILAVSVSFAFMQSSTMCSRAASRYETSVIFLATSNDILFALSKRCLSPFAKSSYDDCARLSALAIAIEHMLFIFLSAWASTSTFGSEAKAGATLIGAFDDLLNHFIVGPLGNDCAKKPFILLSYCPVYCV